MADQNDKRDREAAAEADRTKRQVENMGTGNTPHGKDDPQHGQTVTPMTPGVNQTGGKGGKP